MATLPEDDRSTTYTLGSATAGPFLVGFTLFDDDELRVSVNGTASTAFTVTSDYTDGYDDSASITFDSALSVADVVLIEGVVALSREADLVNGAPNLVSSINTELTRITAAGQETRRDASAALTLAQSASETVTELEVDLNSAVTSASASATAAAASAASAAEDAALLGEWRGTWATATAYAVGDRAQSGGSTYLCVEAHTSAGAFNTDFVAGKWELFASKGDSGAGTGDLVSTNNLSDVDDAATARTNLGLTSVATLATTAVTLADASLYTGDLDSLATSGWRRLNTGCTNIPSGLVSSTNDAVLTFYANSSAIYQVYYEAGSESLWIRSKSSASAGAWTQWKELYSSSNVSNNADFSVSTGLLATRSVIATYVQAQAKLQLETQVAISGGETAVDWTSIPSGVNEIVVMLDGVSLSGTDRLLIQLGDSGGFEATGYASSLLFNNSTTNTKATETTGFCIGGLGGSVLHTGVVKLVRMTGNKWQISGTIDRGASFFGAHATGTKTLSAELDRIRITRSGSDTFDAGFINISHR